MRECHVAHIVVIPDVTNQEGCRNGECGEHGTLVRFDAALLDEVQTQQQQRCRYCVERGIQMYDGVRGKERGR
jgi:hypothetical protein